MSKQAENGRKNGTALIDKGKNRVIYGTGLQKGGGGVF